ncbi:MAG: hypothetical protein KKI08_00740 [Armatimonadetes bacterium]|nr:hypothetical protein [Armatimonadota bacterium]
MAHSFLTLEIADGEPDVGIRIGGTTSRRVPLQSFLDSPPTADVRTPIIPPYVKGVWYRGGGIGLLTAVLTVFGPGPTVLSWTAELLDQETGGKLVLDLPYVVVPLLFKTIDWQTTILTDARLLFAQEAVTWDTPLSLPCLPNVAVSNPACDPRQQDEVETTDRTAAISPGMVTRNAWLCFTPFQYSVEQYPLWPDPASGEAGQVARLVEHLWQAVFNDSAQHHEGADCWHSWLDHPHPANKRMRSLEAWQAETRRRPGFTLKERFWPMLSPVTEQQHTVGTLVGEMLDRVHPAQRIASNSDIIDLALKSAARY